MQFLFERAHGLLLPGGGANLYRNFDRKEGHGQVTVGFLKMWRHIQKMWTKGINFPIWGTCLGLEIMLLCISNDTKILSNLNNRGFQGEVYLDYENSAIFKKMPLDLRLNIENKKLLNFHHVYGISVKKFTTTTKLHEKLKVTGISRDQDGKWFCAMLEGRDRPIFLSQFHPEKQAFQWTSKGDVVGNKPSIELSQHIAQSFVLECMKCKTEKTFNSMAELQFYNFQQFRQIYTPQKLYKVYAIDFKFREYDKEHKKRISEKQIGTSSKKIFN
jgi:gamma-glutamyl hydrolase